MRSLFFRRRAVRLSPRLPLLLLLVLILSLELIPGCASETVYPRNPLALEILTPRPGHEGKLTNRTCKAYKGQKCTDPEIVEYDLADATFRSTVNKLGFICNLGGRRFKVCEDKPGFCRISYKEKCFLWFCSKGDRTEEFIPITPYQFILDARTRCFAKDSYPFDAP